ncbi:hypothetical protein [Streptomyces resistomycificus]|uniref:hypothetical protein n=1 Tax=Streptomyces resistomycificus TaxID=67356 RepID=UPI00068BCBD5|nr:hypothetical protein [Streptomyces resistomycificus]KUO01769.1 hypothetical protein AQJ84_04915 [Streptomyces resistomycificus]
MEVATLVLLGAAGGALRGLLDVYTRFLDWQTDRRAHRRLPLGQQSEPPRFRSYFDPIGDPVAAVVHSAMGAGAAVLLGTTGQISGAYAALVVGISAPVILTQLGRVQSVNDALTGGQVSAQQGAEQQQTPVPTTAVAPLTATPTAVHTLDTPAPAALSEPRPVAGAVSADGDGPPADLRQATRPDETPRPHPNGRPANPAGGPDRGRRGREVPPQPQQPVLGEEGTG